MDLAPAAEPWVDPEAAGRVGARAAGLAAGVLERHGGRVERLFGDTLMAFFGFPVAHEDDPLRAARAALEACTAVHALDQDASRVEGVRNRLRAGIETGDIVVAGPGAAVHDVVSGPVVAQAGQLEKAGENGQVIVGPAAARLLRGTVILKPVEPSPWRERRRQHGRSSRSSPEPPPSRAGSRHRWSAARASSRGCVPPFGARSDRERPFG